MEWRLMFADQDKEAAESRTDNPRDVTVPQARPEQGDGARFFRNLDGKDPAAVRMALETRLGDWTGGRLSKGPRCPPEIPDGRQLTARLAQVAELERFVSDPKLRGVALQVSSLPCLPEARRRLILHLDCADPNAKDVAETIRADVGMAAKAMQLAFSGLFGTCGDIAGPEQAVAFLGVGNIKSLFMSGNIFGRFAQDAVPGFCLSELCEHSRAVSDVAWQIAAAESDREQVIQQSRMAGLFHDIGKLVFATAMPAEYAQVLDAASKDGARLNDIEAEALGADHAQVGAYLMGLWGLPGAIVRAIAHHHRPSEDVEGVFGPVAATHAADVLVRSEEDKPQAVGGNSMDTPYLSSLGMESRLPAWRAICRNVVCGAA